jgi:lactate dehydrogenase-like 2-hydroxyacid dehydrogenase
MAKRPTVLVTRKLPAAVEARLERDYEARLNPDDSELDTEALLRAAQGADAIMPCHSERFPAEVIRRLPDSVKIIANFSVGTDHVDLAAAEKRGLVVTNTPEVLNDATAEVTMLLLLGAARRASEGERLVRAGGWQSWSPAFMVGTQVTGKTIGIVGMGRVGKVVAERCRGFAMTIHYHNQARLPAEQEKGATFHARLEDMLPHCDVVSMHCPNTPETRGIINHETIAAMKDGVIFVNAARGTLVDEDALMAALASGKIRAAGLDVYQNEPCIDPRWAAIDNVFLLPHIGSATAETRDAMGFRALDNLDAFFAGRPPGDRVA